MIGVVATLEEAEAVAEFFELFKTPWEAAVPGRKYGVLLSATESAEPFEADVILVYGSTRRPIDDDAGVQVTPVNEVVEVDWEGSPLPLYTGVARFSGSNDYRRRSDDRKTWRIGYNLFSEVRHLLTLGQPAKFALIPTLELHIALLRHLLVQSGVSFVEIPPRPDKYDFICCLTHDIDFFGIRRHRWDRT